MIDDKVAMQLFWIVYTTQSKRGKGSPSSLALLRFKIIRNTQDQNNDFDKPYQKPRLIFFNKILKVFRPRPKIETSQHFKCSHTLWPRSGTVNRFRKLVMIYQIWFFPNNFKTNILRYPLRVCNIRLSPLM